MNKPRKNKSSRYIKKTTVLNLWVRSGGRCEFRGCNKYLLREDLTQYNINQSHIAHIVAINSNGPRGKDSLPFNQRNKIKNLILLCFNHHKIIDDKKLVNEYPKELLIGYKKTHEDRIYNLTSASPNIKTKIIRLKANIGNEIVNISEEEIRKAIEPRFPDDPQGIEIDFTKILQDETNSSSAAKSISQIINKFYTPGIKKNEFYHVSVFALGPIPLLVQLGHCLSNKIETDLYQRHRDTNDWVWKEEGKNFYYKLERITKGKNENGVVLILSLSGKIHKTALPKEVTTKNFNIYEITLRGIKPNLGFLRKKSDLEKFRNIYQKFLAKMRNNFSNLKEVHLFPAIPAPIAVLCGLELLKKKDPSLLIYDYNRKVGFYLSLKI